MNQKLNQRSHLDVTRIRSATLPSNNDTDKRQLIRAFTNPQETIEYMVSSSDTLAGIAARFDTTPSELTEINRLSSRLIFPGQILFVPKKSENHSHIKLVTPPNSPNDKSSNESLEQLSPKPGKAMRISSHSSEGSGEESHSISQTQDDLCTNFECSERSSHNIATIIDPADRECLERFLKINVRYITDGMGVVCGVLLVTPNALMFDPSVSDPLVLEHGVEMYGVYAPMDFVMRAAMYSDIAHMRTKHAPEYVSSIPKPSIYHAQAEESILSLLDSAKVEIYEQPVIVLSKNTKVKEKFENKDENNKKIEKKIECDNQLIKLPSEDDINIEGQSKKFEKEQVQYEKCENKEKQLEKDIKNEKENKKENQNVKEKETETDYDGVGDGDNYDKKDKEEKLKLQSSDVNILKNVKHEVGEEKETQIKFDEEDQCSTKCSPTNQSEKLISNVKVDLKQVKDSNQTKLSSNLESVNNLQSSSGINQISNESTTATLLKVHSFPQIQKSCSIKEKFEIVKRRSVKGESKKDQMFKRLSSPVESLTSYTKVGINKVLSTPKNVVEFSSGLVKGAKDALITVGSKSECCESDIDPNTTKQISFQSSLKSGDNRNLISYQNVADESVTDILSDRTFTHLLPKTSKSYEDPHLYLCLRMGRPKEKNWEKKYYSSIMSFGKKKIEREYWFSIPKSKVDNLYHFFKRWAPEVYGDIEDFSDVDKRGLKPIDTDDEEEFDNNLNQNLIKKKEFENKSSGREQEKNTKFWRRRVPLNFLTMVQGHFSDGIIPSEWDVVDDSQECYPESVFEVSLPDLIGESEILTEEHRKCLCKHLPARAEGYSWSLLYSTLRNGFSLKTLYRTMANYENPVLLVIQDTSNTILGVLTSNSLHLSDHFYGTGETFLFSFHPEFKCFPWTGENLFFIKGDPEGIAFGCGDGNYGLWLDGDLYHGSSKPCLTFGNPQLSPHQDFVVKALECWGFV